MNGKRLQLGSEPALYFHAPSNPPPLPGDGETTETLKTCIAADNCYAGSISFTTDAGVHMRSASTCCQDSFCNQRELNCKELPVPLS